MGVVMGLVAEVWAPSLAAVRDLRTLVPTSAVNSSVVRLVSRLGAVAIVSPERWRPLANRLCAEHSSFDQLRSGHEGATQTTAVLIGPPAFVLKHAADAEHNFGFVMPVAQTGRQRSRIVSWRDDATLELWKLGWSPRALDRVLQPMQASTIEFAIGDVRRTPLITSV